jgi:hypothetical protein
MFNLSYTDVRNLGNFVSRLSSIVKGVMFLRINLLLYLYKMFTRVFCPASVLWAHDTYIPFPQTDSVRFWLLPPRLQLFIKSCHHFINLSLPWKFRWSASSVFCFCEHILLSFSLTYDADRHFFYRIFISKNRVLLLSWRESIFR